MTFDNLVAFTTQLLLLSICKFHCTQANASSRQREEATVIGKLCMCNLCNYSTERDSFLYSKLPEIPFLLILENCNIIFIKFIIKLRNCNQMFSYLKRKIIPFTSFRISRYIQKKVSLIKNKFF